MPSTSCDTQFLKEMCFAIRTYSTNITSPHFPTPWSARTSTQTARVLLKGSVWLSKGNTEVTQAAGVLLECFRGTFSLGVDTDVSVHFRIHIGLPKLLTCACWEALKIFPSPSWSAWIGCVCVSVQVQLLRCCLCALVIRLGLFVDSPASGTGEDGECNHLNDIF